DFAALADALAAVQPAGPTNVAPALKRAAELTDPDRRTLALVVSDLQARPFDPAEMAETYRRAGLELAVIGTNVPRRLVDLERLARRLDAPMVPRYTLQGLAELMGSLVSQARGETTRRGEFTLRLAPAAWGGEAPERLTVPAYLVSAAREGAELLGRIEGNPAVARWSIGLGRSAGVALPPEVLGRSHALVEMLARAVAWTRRPGADRRFAAELRREDGRLRVALEARQGERWLGGLSLTAAWQALGDATEPVVGGLTQVGPGRYAGELPAPASAAVVVVRNAAGRVVWRGGAGRSAPPEVASLGADLPALQAVAERANGLVVRPDLLASRLRTARRAAFTPLWPVLLGASLALMLVEWAAARLRH
ncbi:MAG: hypothetical protein ACOC93_01280, partial [Planctomycetota bacterium]